MQAKEFLNRPFILNNKINDKKIKLECYRTMASSVSSPGFEEHYSSSKNTSAPYMKYLEKAMELESEIESDYKKLNDLLLEVDEAIDKVDDLNEQTILRYRYVMFMTMSQIAQKIHYTLRWTQETHRNALSNFERVHRTS